MKHFKAKQETTEKIKKLLNQEIMNLMRSKMKS
jgi:hypothetical protein